MVWQLFAVWAQKRSSIKFDSHCSMAPASAVATSHMGATLHLTRSCQIRAELRIYPPNFPLFHTPSTSCQWQRITYSFYDMVKLNVVDIITVCWFAHVGNTDWAQNERATGTTEVELNKSGIAEARKAAQHVGVCRKINPNHVKYIFASPQTRVTQTIDAMKAELRSRCDETQGLQKFLELPIEQVDDLREWDYGSYEGLTKADIGDQRQQRGLLDQWSVWTHGCQEAEGE